MLVNNLNEGSRKEILEVLDNEILNEGVVHYSGACHCLEDDGQGYDEYYFDLYTEDGKLYEVMYYKGKLEHKLEWTDKARKEEILKLMAQRINKFGIYYDEELELNLNSEFILSDLEVYEDLFLDDEDDLDVDFGDKDEDYRPRYYDEDEDDLDLDLSDEYDDDEDLSLDID